MSSPGNSRHACLLLWGRDVDRLLRCASVIRACMCLIVFCGYLSPSSLNTQWGLEKTWGALFLLPLGYRLSWPVSFVVTNPACVNPCNLDACRVQIPIQPVQLGENCGDVFSVVLFQFFPLSFCWPFPFFSVAGTSCSPSKLRCLKLSSFLSQHPRADTLPYWGAKGR